MGEYRDNSCVNMCQHSKSIEETMVNVRADFFPILLPKDFKHGKKQQERKKGSG